MRQKSKAIASTASAASDSKVRTDILNSLNRNALGSNHHYLLTIPIAILSPNRMSSKR